MTPHLTKSFTATAAVPGYRIVKFGAADNTVVPASAATDLSIGITDSLSKEAGEIADVIQSGWAELKLGGTVGRGASIVPDADAAGVTAAPGAGVTVRAVGFAMASGVVGDIIPVLLVPHTVRG
jgi:hypothetical protein